MVIVIGNKQPWFKGNYESINDLKQYKIAEDVILGGALIFAIT